MEEAGSGCGGDQACADCVSQNSDRGPRTGGTDLNAPRCGLSRVKLESSPRKQEFACEGKSLVLGHYTGSLLAFGTWRRWKTWVEARGDGEKQKEESVIQVVKTFSTAGKVNMSLTVDSTLSPFLPPTPNPGRTHRGTALRPLPSHRLTGCWEGGRKVWHLSFNLCISKSSCPHTHKKPSATLCKCRGNWKFTFHYWFNDLKNAENEKCCFKVWGIQLRSRTVEIITCSNFYRFFSFLALPLLGQEHLLCLKIPFESLLLRLYNCTDSSCRGWMFYFILFYKSILVQTFVCFVLLYTFVGK